MTTSITRKDVEAIVLNLTADSNSFIDTADIVVTEYLSGKGLSTSLLDKITLYLAAHLTVITVEKGGLKSSKTGDAKDVWVTSSMGEGLKATRYGQTVEFLDSSGTLVNSNKPTARFQVVSSK